MFTKRFVMVALMAGVAALPGTRAAADFADGLVGGLVGGAVSGIIVNESAKARERKRTTTTTTQRVYRAPSVSSQQVREEQTALNYFGFPAGTPDGVRGRNTRNATSQFQSHMGYPVTGYLQDYERQFLISAYYRAQSGGMTTSQLIAQRGQGTRGLLHAYRDEAMGVPQQQQPPVMAAVPQAAQVPQAAPQTQEASGSGGGGALPNLMASGGDGPSLASHCNQVSLVTNSNGGFVTAAAMHDARFALNEQFCLARTYAIAEGESMASALKGITPETLEEQCRAFGPAMRDHVAALSLKERQEVLDGVRSFVLQTGQSPAQLAGTAKICLSVGYRIDNMTVALGSGLLLTSLGEEAYSELMGHHLNEGFGTARRPDLAEDWYAAAIAAVENGAEPVFAPGNSDRNALLRQAVFGVDAAPGGETVQPASALPTFNLD